MRTSLLPLFASLTLVAAAVVACAGAPSPGVGGTAPPVDDAGPSEAGPDSGDAGPAVLAAPKVTPVEDPELARIAALPEAERLAYARAHLPELKDLRSGTTPVDFSRFLKAGHTVALFVPEELLQHDAPAPQGLCRRVVFEVQPESLHAEIPTDGGEGRPKLARSGSFEHLELDRNVTLYGPHNRTIQTDARGQKTESMTAYGSAWSPSGTLFEIRDDAILYGATRVSAHAVCMVFEEHSCAEADGGVGACARCTRLVAKLHSHEPGHAFGIAVARGRRGPAEGEALPACAACPVDAVSAEIPRINRALAGLVFEDTSGDAWPAFFMKREACVAAARKHAEETRRAQ
ncbi:hypothetical protein KEG38_27275 [Polyangium jinanense]|uniref:hypothetical protein n=1 Tax=Polyangium jinanense TaxID=2829994 RepID=UPI00233F7C6A|nr:hypothetical protein [Polyangium jinanense]MDC3957590.1 hypothetical protein [Polyangium jinanense]